MRALVTFLRTRHARRACLCPTCLGLGRLRCTHALPLNTPHGEHMLARACCRCRRLSSRTHVLAFGGALPNSELRAVPGDATFRSVYLRVAGAGTQFHLHAEHTPSRCLAVAFYLHAVFEHTSHADSYAAWIVRYLRTAFMAAHLFRLYLFLLFHSTVALPVPVPPRPTVELFAPSLHRRADISAPCLRCDDAGGVSCLTFQWAF